MSDHGHYLPTRATRSDERARSVGLFQECTGLWTAGRWLARRLHQLKASTTSSTVPVHIYYVLTTDTADHEQVWQPYAVDPYYSAISKWWPYLSVVPINKGEYQVSVKHTKFYCFFLYGHISTQLQYPVVMSIL